MVDTFCYPVGMRAACHSLIVGRCEQISRRAQLMAKKKKKKPSAKSAAVAASVDQDTIMEAYKEGLTKVFLGFHNQCIGKDPEADANFSNGISILRDARDRALKLI